MTNDHIKIDLSYLKDVSDGNVEFIIDMIDIFLMQTPEQVANLSKAIAEEDYPKVAEVAHKIKPTLAFVGANDARDTMQTIEHRARYKENVDTIKADFDALKDVIENLFVGLQQAKEQLAGKA